MLYVSNQFIEMNKHSTIQSLYANPTIPFMLIDFVNSCYPWVIIRMCKNE